MLRFLIDKPVAVIMVFIALTLLGLVAAWHIPVSPLPDISIPEITVHVSKRNASSRDLESSIVQGLRMQLQQVPALENIHSETRDGYSIIKLRFKYGTAIDYAFIEVNEKIDLSMNNFPRDMERPRVVKATATDIPVFYLNLRLNKNINTSDHAAKFIELSDFANQVIKRRLEQLPEIAFADISGLSNPEIFIVPNQDAVAALNLKEEDFKRIIQSNNLIFDDISAIDGVLRYNIRFAVANPVSLEDIRNITFEFNERIFKLHDVAQVGIRQQESKGLFVSDQQDAVSIAVIKQPDAKLDNLRTAVDQLTESLKNEYPDILVEQTQDQTALLEFSITNLKQDLLIGSFLAFLLMFFFLKNIRAPLLIGITIPICLILSLLFFSLIHLTINIISLSGLVLGVGLMIDNSIIVIDNITQKRERGLTLSEACIKGTTEIIRPLMASAFTTCSVFLPLIFLSGVAGALFYDQAVAITIGLAVSLLVSVLLLPILYRLFHKRQTKVRLEYDFFEKYGITFFERIYESGFSWVFKHKMSSLGIVMLLMITNVFLFIHLKKEKLPVFVETELLTHIDWNRNISIAENKSRLIALTKYIEGNITQSNAMVGEQQYLLNKDKELSSSEVLVYVKIRDSKLMGTVKEEINKFIHRCFPEASISMRPPKSIFEQVLGDPEPDLVLELSQNSDELLPGIPLINQLKNQIVLAFPEVKISPVPIQQTLTLRVDAEKLMLYGLSIEGIYNKLRSTINVSKISDLTNGIQQIPIVVTTRDTTYLDQVMSGLDVVNNKGVVIPVSGFLRVHKDQMYKTIEGGKDGDYVSLAVDTKNPEPIIHFVNEQLKGQNKLNVKFAGSYFSNRELIKEMAIVLIVAVLLLYFILAAQFESLVQPLIVLFELPISMCGALIMLFVFNSSINLISLIGLVVMCGIIINDSILKIDTVNQLRRNEGYTLMDAIHTAGIRRLKSIIMTAMTTILSVAPFLFGSDIGSLLQRPLSLALIGGMLLGTPVSLYFIPLVYWFYYRDEKMTINQNSGQ